MLLRHSRQVIYGYGGGNGKRLVPMPHQFGQIMDYVRPDHQLMMLGTKLFRDKPRVFQFVIIARPLEAYGESLHRLVAKLTHKVSRRGDFLDHALDRYADVFMVGGLALSAWCRYPSIGLAAIVGMLLTSYMGTQSQAIGYKRDYSGLLVRADRLVLLMITPLVQHILLHYDIQILWGLSLLEWVLIYFAVMGNITAVQRFYTTLKYV